MAVDFQTVLPQESIQLTRIRLTQLAGLKAIDVQGNDFRAVDEVQINEIPSPDVMVVSRTRLIAQLPASLQTTPDIQSVVVLANTLTLNQRSLLRFRIGDTPGRVVGILRLLQLFVKILFSNPGTDIFSPNTGGGALRNVGATFGSDEGDGIKADFTIAVDRTARHIISTQSRNGRIPRDERLLRATVLGATFSRATGSLFMQVEVVAQDGKAARANLEM